LFGPPLKMSRHMLGPRKDVDKRKVPSAFPLNLHNCPETVVLSLSDAIAL
jgi:hypothetical protein